MKKEMDYNNVCRTEQIRLFTSLPRISSPRNAAFEIMRSAMRVYQADWCGILDVDLTANTYCPYWWIEEGKGEMAETLFHSVELSEFYEGWAEALKRWNQLWCGTEIWIPMFGKMKKSAMYVWKHMQ